jgi:isocitrate dehydrogenase
LPNVSASIPQLTEAIAELQSQGYDIPNFPANPSTAEEKDIHAKYSNVLGSAVNPVLREGNSDRRVAAPVKEYAQKNPHKMGAYDPNCRSEVVHMQDDDFFSSEQSYIMPDAGTVRIEHVASDGTVTVMKDNFELQQGEVIDASKMDCGKLCEFFEKELTAAKEKGLMISLHMKATMMKVSDPIMFGHCVKVYYKDVFAKHGATFDKIGANPNNGIGDIYEKIATLPDAERKEIEADLMATYETRPGLAMVNSNKGITNLHVPSDVIIDASMPVVVRDSGKMWNKDDALEDVVCMVPDRSYAPFYKTVLEDCKKNGQFDVSTMGNVPNVGLMAQKAEEYGSHDKTFEIATGGTMRVVDGNGKEIFTHAVNEGDIWRMAQTKDAPIKDWVRLAVSRARATGSPAVFWLDANRAHDASLMSLVDKYLPEHDTSGLDIHVMKPVDAVQFSMDRARKGEDTISVTGNVLRDYLTDLFPILELGTSAKMLSIVPLLAGGGLFETGAGGSAPKHVQQFVEEGHLRWDSLGEYLALAVAFEDLGEKTNNERAKLLGQTLTEATGKLLDNRKAPSRKVNELDNRGSTFYIAMYWAEAMAKHDSEFEGLAKDLADNETKIIDDLIQCQGTPIDIGGYYKPDPVKTEKAMRPSETFNNILGN